MKKILAVSHPVEPRSVGCPGTALVGLDKGCE